MKDMKKYIQNYIDNYKQNGLTTFYVEGFLGGANSFLPIEADCKIGIDINKYLISLLKLIRNKVKLYVPTFENFTREQLYEDYHWIKKVIKEERKSIPHALVAIYLLVYSYRASWAAGLTTFGRKWDKRARLENQINRLNEHVDDFKGDEMLIWGDYTHKLDDILFYKDLTKDNIGIVYYLDPPYPNSYQENYISQFEYDKKFYDFIKSLFNQYKNITILISGWIPPEKCEVELIYTKQIIFSASHSNQTNKKNDNLYRILGVKDE